MDRNFLGPLFLICVCGKVTIVDRCWWGLGEVVGICRNFWPFYFLFVCVEKLRLLIGVGEDW